MANSFIKLQQIDMAFSTWSTGLELVTLSRVDIKVPSIVEALARTQSFGQKANVTRILGRCWTCLSDRWQTKWLDSRAIEMLCGPCVNARWAGNLFGYLSCCFLVSSSKWVVRGVWIRANPADRTANSFLVDWMTSCDGISLNLDEQYNSKICFMYHLAILWLKTISGWTFKYLQMEVSFLLVSNSTTLIKV